VDEIKAEDLLGDYPAVRYYPPSGDLYFDVMTRLGEVASYETVDAETKSVEDIGVRVATPRALLHLKRSTVCPLDRGDADVLQREFDLEDEQVPVQRFRSVEEMDDAPVLAPRGEGFERFARHCAGYWAIAPRSYPRGVFRFRSLAEAQAARARVTRENVARLRGRDPLESSESPEEP
jgi:hypothetical protein